MKLFGTLAAGGLALATLAGPATAQHTTTVVTRVKGPLHVLPHHKRKICTYRTVHHKRIKKCHYN